MLGGRPTGGSRDDGRVRKIEERYDGNPFDCGRRQVTGDCPDHPPGEGPNLVELRKAAAAEFMAGFVGGTEEDRLWVESAYHAGYAHALIDMGAPQDIIIEGVLIVPDDLGGFPGA